MLLELSPCSAAELIFRTGFESDCRGIGGTAITDIVGADQSLDGPNHFVDDLEEHPKIGFFNVQYVGGDRSQWRARIADDPTGAVNPTSGSTNRTLHFWLREVVRGAHKSRVQTAVYRCTSLTEITQRARMYLHNDLRLLDEYEEPIRHLTIEEFWSPPGWPGYEQPFRISLSIWKDGMGIAIFSTATIVTRPPLPSGLSILEAPSTRTRLPSPDGPGPARTRPCVTGGFTSSRLWSLSG